MRIIMEKWNRYQKRKRTARELYSLTDRELQDLGIVRCNIPQVLKHVE